MAKSSKKNKLVFSKKLVLNKFMLSLFGVDSIEKLSMHMEKEGDEWLLEEGVSNFHYSLLQGLSQSGSKLTVEELLGYDGNIVQHTESIQGKRPDRIRWKYFQYLALLFNEVYLDRFSNDSNKLMTDANNFLAGFNTKIPQSDKIDRFVEGDLNKLTLWCATGSGKTLLMHVNIKQFLHYCHESKRRNKLNRILLVTPNEGLSNQHLHEFELSEIHASQFSKHDSTLFSGEHVEVIEITKLGEANGEKTVPLDSFEGNNLVLVDEGHRGASGDVWNYRRKKLAEDGFTFEYSATIAQAISANESLIQEYAKSVIFDYSYKYFYKDGYGKDFRIFNLPVQLEENSLELYMTGCLISVYQQKELFNDRKSESRKFNIEDPLLVFVGGSVTKSISNDDISDIIEILLFLSRFVAPGFKDAVIGNISRILSGSTGFLNSQGFDIFANMFSYLNHTAESPEKVYKGILMHIFNTDSGASLHLDELKSASGEISIRVGENEPFGVINVGDPSKLCNMCQKHDSLAVSVDHFRDSLFNKINAADSKLNVLMGSRKFNEGWNSWRVSTMGLMNIGRKEGSQIIQLFGRGVRLKGFEHSLKRHSALNRLEFPINEQLSELETLNVFGIRADYMDNFRMILNEEGVPAEENVVEAIIPVFPTLGNKKLKIMRIAEGKSFVKEGKEIILEYPKERNRIFVSLDYYPKIQSLVSQEIKTLQHSSIKKSGKFSKDKLAMLDFDDIYFGINRLKKEKGWHNLTVKIDQIRELFEDDSWYEILIPEEYMEANSVQKVSLWQEIAANLVEKFCDRFYRLRQSEWEIPFREYHEISESDPDFISEYRLLIDRSEEQVIQQISFIREQIETGKLPTVDYTFGKAQTIFFDRHLYQPLLYSEDGVMKIGQVVLNRGERQFILDLKSHFQKNPEFFGANELYILRNLGRGRGVGFFEAGNFFPDFILWLVNNGKQHISFIDPKGLVKLEKNSPKLEFFTTIKKIEKQMGDENVVLNSFILSVTPYEMLRAWRSSGWTKQKFQSRNVYFQEDSGYIGRMMESIIS